MKNSVYFFLAWGVQSFLSLLNPAFAQSARLDALSVQGIALADAGSASYNPSLPAVLQKSAAGFYICKPYGIEELTVTAFQVQAPVLLQTTGAFRYQQSGTPFYTERNFLLGLARNFTEKISGGIGIRYATTQSNDEFFSPVKTWSSLAGMTFLLRKGCRFGIAVERPEAFFKEQIRNASGEPRLLFGTLIELSSQVRFIAEASSDKSKDIPALASGIEYQPAATVCIRTGYSFELSSLSFGAGYQVKKLQVDIAGQLHPLLGITPSLSCIYSFK